MILRREIPGSVDQWSKDFQKMMNSLQNTLTVEEVKNLKDEADIDGSGRIDYRLFAKECLHMAAWREGAGENRRALLVCAGRKRLLVWNLMDWERWCGQKDVNILKRS